MKTEVNEYSTLTGCIGKSEPFEADFEQQGAVEVLAGSPARAQQEVLADLLAAPKVKKTKKKAAKTAAKTAPIAV
jgi:hypothetical protein